MRFGLRKRVSSGGRLVLYIVYTSYTLAVVGWMVGPLLSSC